MKTEQVEKTWQQLTPKHQAIVLEAVDILLREQGANGKLNKAQETRKRNEQKRRERYERENAEREATADALRLVRDHPDSTPAQILDAIKMIKEMK